MGAVTQDLVELRLGADIEIGELEDVTFIGHLQETESILVGSEMKFDGDEPAVVSLITKKQCVEPEATRKSEKEEEELALNKATGNEDEVFDILTPTPPTRFDEFDGTKTDTRREYETCETPPLSAGGLQVTVTTELRDERVAITERGDVGGTAGPVIQSARAIPAKSERKPDC